MGSGLPYRYAYLHGFGSSSCSRKGTCLAPAFQKRGVSLHLPDLNNPSFSDLTYDGSLEALDELHAATGGEDAAPWRIIGSSMGGYLAARWAELHPSRVNRLLLLCPGFGLVKRWPAMLGPELYEAWRNTGSHLFLDGEGNPTPVSWRFVENATTHPSTPEVPVETLIIHGVLDEVVPLESSIEYARSRDHVELITVDDDHGLAASLPMIETRGFEFFQIS